MPGHSGDSLHEELERAEVVGTFLLGPYFRCCAEDALSTATAEGQVGPGTPVADTRRVRSSGAAHVLGTAPILCFPGFAANQSRSQGRAVVGEGTQSAQYVSLPLARAAHESGHR